MGRYDALYFRATPRARYARDSGCDLAEVSAPVTANTAAIRLLRRRAQGSDPAFVTGGPTPARAHILIGKNVQAGRMWPASLHQPGNWASCRRTSMPPCSKRPIYTSICRALLGLQLVYTDPLKPELVVAVREGDVVAMPVGYIPTWPPPAAPSVSCG